MKAYANRLREAMALARRNGSAIAIGHPYPETLALLESELPRLALGGIQVVPASRVIAQRSEPVPVWRVSWTP